MKNDLKHLDPSRRCVGTINQLGYKRVGQYCYTNFLYLIWLDMEHDVWVKVNRTNNKPSHLTRDEVHWLARVR